MKDFALELAARHAGVNAKKNAIREYLQIYILRALYDEGFFRETAFIGGTALRLLHGLPRYSEDLDFSAINGKKPAFEFVMKKLKQELVRAGYEISMTINDRKTVNSAMVKFSRLLYDAGISPLPGQRLSVKIEIDTMPPSGAVLESAVINRYLPVSLLSYDISSLFAGKLHAVLTRRYTKGRDFYDIGWYLSRGQDLEPNMKLLHNALKQSGWKGEIPEPGGWQSFLADAIRKADWAVIKKDLETFLENPKDSGIFTRKNVLALIEKTPQR